MATALDAWKDGVQRVRKAPAILVGAFAITVFSTLPMAFVLHASIATHLGNSMAAVEAVEGFNLDWWQEFSTQTSSLSETFSPSIIGFAATLNNLSSILDGQLETPAIAWALGINFLIWTFLFGGIIDRYARQHATKASGFFTTSGVFFFRFLRLAVISLGVYWFLFSLVHGWIFNNWYSWATHEITVERTAFFWRLIMYVIFGTLLVIANIVFDYAKIRAVVEDRRSMLGALLSAIRFIIRHPGRNYQALLIKWGYLYWPHSTVVNRCPRRKRRKPHNVAWSYRSADVRARTTVRKTTLCSIANVSLSGIACTCSLYCKACS